MTFTDYLVDSILILLVVRQLRTSRLDRRALLLPLIIVAVVGKSYLHGIPTSGDSLLLVVLFVGLGLTLGTCSALTTRVWADGGKDPLVKAGWIAAGLWVIGMGGRMTFAIWASHGGAAPLARFSIAHHITGENTWTAALVLMALAEVASRVGMLYVRGQRALQARPAELAAA